MAKAVSVAIVGGGFSGAALSAYLLKKSSRPIHLTVIEPRGEIGWGVTYGDAAPSHILNVPASKMSLWEEWPEQFLDWARVHGPSLGWSLAAGATADSYLPRRLYGHYLQKELEKAVQIGAARGSSLHHQPERVTEIRRQPGGFAVQLAGGDVVAAQQVVLATGFRPPSLPFPVSGEGDAVIADPWAPGALDRIGRHDPVLIAGLGLTMIDMVYSLAAQGHRGPITAVSRHGLLPRIHGVTQAMPSLLSPEDAGKGVVHCLRLFRKALAEGRGEWRSLIDSLRPQTNALWGALPPDQQARFNRHLRPYWEVHRHRMPAESADLLLARQAKAWLAVQAAKIAGISVTGDGALVDLEARDSGEREEHRVRWVINCTPAAGLSAQPQDGLTRSLLTEGLIRLHAAGAGIEAAADGGVVAADGQVVDGLFAIGPLLRGRLAETTAVPFIRPQLDALSDRLLKL